MKILYLIFILPLLQNAVSSRIQVEIEQGVLEGEILDLVTEDGQYYSFKGVPYAEPPIGSLRFKSPRPALTWSGVRNATQHGSVCPQFDNLMNIYIPGDEDCLFLNVYSPNLNPGTLLPVIVFIHGAAAPYNSGSGNVDTYGPSFLIRKNVIVVTINYRLGALGFLCLDTEDVPGNAGLKDQVAALKWVKNNIKHFGGDPSKVTIMGQSAGGASVSLHLASPMSKGLFHRAIVMSGSPYCGWSMTFQPVQRAFVLGKLLGFETNDPDELLTFLQNMPVYELVITSPYIYEEEVAMQSFFSLYHFLPVFETYYGYDTFMTKNTFNSNEFKNKADILFGHTNQEMLLAIDYTSSFFYKYGRYPEIFVPRKIANYYPPHIVLDLANKIRNYYFGKEIDSIEPEYKEFVTYMSYAYFVYDVIQYFIDFPLIGNSTRYLYQFSSVSSRNVYGLEGQQYGITGAGHMDDLMYLFDPKSFKLTLNKNSREFELIEQTTTLFTNFAKYGSPTPDSSFEVDWPMFEVASMNYVDIGNNLTIKSVKDDENISFWKNIYDSIEKY